MDPKLVERYRTNIYKDIYAKWHMDTLAWGKPWVKNAFIEIKEFITTKLSNDVVPSSCFDFDVELIDILERHRNGQKGQGVTTETNDKPAGDVACYQSIFVALMLDALEKKKKDTYAKKPLTLLTHGYKSQLLSCFMAELLGESTIDPFLALYNNKGAKEKVLKFFELI
jgi:hypothetical protein